MVNRDVKNKEPDADPLLLSCDWGSTSFRLKLAHKVTGNSFFTISDPRGIKKMNKSRPDQKEMSSREGFYLTYLKEQISRMALTSERNLDGVPVMISGMASSSIGIQELPYSHLPIELKNPALQYKVIEATDGFRHDVILISGFCASDDVMRGEETQLLGIISEYSLETGLCILPGTHSKHLYINNNVLTDFKTYLTGELFEYLSTQSILSNSISTPEEGFASEAFQQGLQQSVDGNLLHSLFTIRSQDLLYNADKYKSYDFLSGLLIGTELSDLQNLQSTNIILAGARHLHHHYSAALKFFQLDHFTADLNDDLTLSGHRSIINKILN
ncbi:MAG: 2-dehydro-3-deoxygalactonokinase [Balneolales bacterium]